MFSNSDSMISLKARELIVEDPEIMGGVPVFKGTRIPVSTIVTLAKSGELWARVKEDYPSLTEEMFEAALTLHEPIPRQVQPHGPQQSRWTLKSRKVIRSNP